MLVTQRAPSLELDLGPCEARYGSLFPKTSKAQISPLPLFEAKSVPLLIPYSAPNPRDGAVPLHHLPLLVVQAEA